MEINKKGLSDQNNGVAPNPGDNPGYESAVQKLREYALENPGKAISISTLTSGGLLLLVYFLRIGFMPDISLDSATALLYAVALFGLFVLVMCSAYFVLPVLVAKVFWGGGLEVNKPDPVNAVEDRQSGSDGEAKAIQDNRNSALWVSGLASFSFWSFILFRLLRNEGAAVGGDYWVEFLCLAAVELALALFVVCKFDRPNRSLKEGLCPALKIVGFSAIQIFSLSVVVLLTIGLGKDGLSQMKDADAIAAVIIVLLLSAFAPALLNVATLSWSKTLVWTIGLGPALLMMMLVLTQSFSSPSALIVSKLGFGEVATASLVLTGKGCKVLNRALGQKHCEEVKDDEPTTVCPVSLRSRIGQQVLVEVAPMNLFVNEGVVTLGWVQDEHGRVLNRSRVVLDKANLLAWSQKPNIEVVRPSDADLTKYSEVSASVWYAKSMGEFDLLEAKFKGKLEELCGKKAPKEADKKVDQDKKTPESPPPPVTPPKKHPPRVIHSTACCCSSMTAVTSNPVCLVPPREIQ